jgi:uncharacterized peroxidase-related enzyme
MTDYTAAALTPADRAMLDYVVTLTLTPAAVTSEDVTRLREAGFDDETIHHIVQVTALFAYYNRMIDGLGGEHEPEW